MLRAARRGHIERPFVGLACERLRSMGDARPTACIDLVRLNDASFDPYDPGELE